MLLSNKMIAANPRAVASPARPFIRPAVAARSRVVVVRAHGSGAAPHGHGQAPSTDGKPREKPEKEKGFINEMRMVAMKLHTRDQSPKEGGKESAVKENVPWAPTREGYLRFLSESKAVYEILERVMLDGKHPQFSSFVNTGLERSAALEKDIKWFEETYGLKAPPLRPDGPGATYGKMISDLADSDPQAFIAHYYNFYFAHTAGGRMIGSKVAQMILDSKSLNFYEYEGEVANHLDAVRRSINALSEGWSREQKDHCLAATESSFTYSGAIMKCITEKA